MVRHITVAFAFWVLLGGVGNANPKSKEFFTVPELQYPIINTSMVAAVGVVDIELEFPILRSVAIVGADEISAHWLRLNNDYLMDLDAIGLVINVESKEQLDVLQMYTDIPLFGAPGFAVPSFGEVYPIVVDKTAGRVRQ